VSKDASRHHCLKASERRERVSEEAVVERSVGRHEQPFLKYLSRFSSLDDERGEEAIALVTLSPQNAPALSVKLGPGPMGNNLPVLKRCVRQRSIEEASLMHRVAEIDRFPVQCQVGDVDLVFLGGAYYVSSFVEPNFKKTMNPACHG
jgi:hypothetical protein